MIPEKKICGRCNIEKVSADFPLRKKGGGKYVWLRLQCYQCMREIRRLEYPDKSVEIIKRNAIYAKKNQEVIAKRNKQWRELNKDKIKEQVRIKNINNAEARKKQRREMYLKDPKKYIKAVSEYAKKNRAKINFRVNEKHKVRKEIDVAYKLKKILRGRVRVAIKNKGVKCARTMELTGCTMPHLLKHIESLFTEGMSWELLIKGQIHIDHKRPCSSFDMANPEEQRKCFNWENLQPLWAIDNLKKSDKIAECYGNTG